MTRTVLANRLTIDRDAKTVTAQHFLSGASACQVHVVIDPDGNMSDPDCQSVSCKGDCSLESEEEGSKTHYWCDCE